MVIARGWCGGSGSGQAREMLILQRMSSTGYDYEQPYEYEKEKGDEYEE
jgi:hypothetical protein